MRRVSAARTTNFMLGEIQRICDLYGGWCLTCVQFFEEILTPTQAIPALALKESSLASFEDLADESPYRRILERTALVRNIRKTCCRHPD